MVHESIGFEDPVSWSLNWCDIQPPIAQLYIWVIDRFRLHLPINVLLNPFNRNNENCLIVIPVFTRARRVGMLSLSHLLTLLGQSGKTENVNIVEDCEEFEGWKDNIIVLDNGIGRTKVSETILGTFPNIFYKKGDSGIVPVDSEFGEKEYGCVIQRLTNKYNSKKRVLLIMGGYSEELGSSGTYALNILEKIKYWIIGQFVGGPELPVESKKLTYN